ncbi:VOC family protein [Catenulispora subtropica]|uniref:VOC family protein n=1 Tax=Catenulispora subtropica TaxID=450798 RepID=A0ABN2S0X9_9ACTN
MTAHLAALAFKAHDPLRLARFWAGVLGWETADDPHGGVTLLPDPDDDTGFRIRFVASQEEKTKQNQMHFDLTSSSWEDQQRTVAGALELGGRPIDVGQGPDAAHVVLADPEGNEFCVIEPGNAFLAECGFIGALASDGSQEVGYFWSRALEWPLVWDQDQETAIRSPHGGPKITWGGPPVAPKTGPNRLLFELTPGPGGDVQAEVERLVALGATRLGPGDGSGGSEGSEGSDGSGASGGSGAVAMADPDGNEFFVYAPAE